MRSVRNATHVYPEQELTAMRAFYGGKKCIITRNTDSVQRAHVLDAASDVCNPRLQWMLDRNLRQNRHPAHAAEVRENVIPLDATTHCRFDSLQVVATLFLHEDLLARTLAFELELQQWRRTELLAGRGDPGRPRYQDVFGTSVTTEHRWHNRKSSFRTEPDEVNASSKCPGVYPHSADPFPEIRTLLSIPFSVLHNLPRLTALMPTSEYQSHLITMAQCVVLLWSWDPSPEELGQSKTIAATNYGASQDRTPRPLPIHHPSRQNTTFTSMRLHITSGITTASSATHRLRPQVNSAPKNTFELPSGKVLFCMSSFVSWKGGEGLQLTAVNEPQPRMVDIKLEPLHLVVEDSFKLISELSDGSSDSQDIESKPLDVMSSASGLDWLNHVNDGAETIQQPLPLTPTPFEKGAIGSMSVNDILMIRGLIDPGVYVQYTDLSSFSHH